MRRLRRPRIPDAGSRVRGRSVPSCCCTAGRATAETFARWWPKFGDEADDKGWAGFTVDEVARRSGVSKATIYKPWSGGLDVATDAYGQVVTDAVPTPASGDVVADLQSQIIRLADFYATPRGSVVVQLLAAATEDPRGGDVVRQKFFAPRRSAALALIEQGTANGQLRADLDPDLTVDVLFGAMVLRLFNGGKPLQGRAAWKVAVMVLRAVVTEG